MSKYLVDTDWAMHWLRDNPPVRHRLTELRNQGLRTASHRTTCVQMIRSYSECGPIQNHTISEPSSRPNPTFALGGRDDRETFCFQ